MRKSRRVAAIAIAVAAVVGGIAMSGSAAAAPVASAKLTTKHVCANSSKGSAHCDAIVLTGSGVTANGIHPNSTTPQGLSPAQLRGAYNLTATSGGTVAIVDAFDDPNAESDLAVYRSTFGLPACTTANGCFRKINQNGGSRPPRSDVGWAEEISLDLDMVSAICPGCHILLVEAKTNSFSNLGAAVNRAAATAGVVAISNSYGGSDVSDASAPFYNHPGIAVTASSGDSGFGVQFPASSHFVTAVGGTHLVMSGNTRVSETVWSGAGSGCSSVNTALTGAASFGTGCAGRAEADVSAVADPNTGVSVYDTFGTGTQWLVFGGTSVASPIIAAVFALAGNTGSIDNNFPYAHSGSFFDITSGSNGSCSPSQLCTARAGWDGPTGLGTPNGTGGF